MKRVTAKQLKQKTGEIMKRVRAGESLTITYRGKPIAVIRPTEEHLQGTVPTQLDEVWKDIELTLASTKPQFSDWREATKWARKRT